MIRVAHISDLHIFNMENLKISKFLNRRALGILNLILTRHNYNEKAIDALIDSLLKEKCDHIIITGDVSNFALDSEFAFIREKFSQFWAFDKLTVLPGNHDFYTGGAFKSKRFNSYFKEILRNNELGTGLNPASAEENLFPVVKNLRDILLVGLNSAILPPPIFAFGFIQKSQLNKLHEISLSFSEKNDSFFVVALHHNLYKRSFFSEVTGRLLNRREVIEAFANARLDLILHGHSHTRQAYFLKTRNIQIPVVCAGSATNISKNPLKNARYNIYSIEKRKFTSETKFYDMELNEFR